VQLVLGAGVILVNLLIYWRVWKQGRIGAGRI
jgi:hypothetical protein